MMSLNYNCFAFSQNLLTDEGSVDVRIRCKDHQPLDGLGAHQLVLAAASPDFLRKVLSGKKMFLNQAVFLIHFNIIRNSINRKI